MINTIKQEVQRLKGAGASYVDARWYPREDEQNLMMWNGNLKSNNFSRQSGIGVRVLYQGAWGFAATTQTDQLSGVFDRAMANAKVASRRVTFPIQLADRPPVQAQYQTPTAIPPLDIPLSEKVAFLKTVDRNLQKDGVEQRIASLDFISKQIVFVDSEGSEIEKKINEVFASMEVMGLDSDGNSHSRSWGLGNDGQGTRGWENIDTETFSSHSERIVKELNEVRVAEACPVDDRSVILLPGIMFLQTHETIGHALELDRILGYELSYAGGSFVTLDDFGQLQYGSSKLTARADATLPNTPGSFGYDDDGVACQNTVLIDKGVLVNAVTSRQMAAEANARAGREIFQGSGGTNRATAFYRVPIERMTNINIDPGDDGTLDDIVRNTEKGIIMDGDRSWSIGSNREQFHFACEIGWMVEDGAISKVVKNPTYKSDTLKFWNNLTAVGDESTWQVEFVDNCGKGQPNQVMQLAHGIPVCRFDDVRIGE